MSGDDHGHEHPTADVLPVARVGHDHRASRDADVRFLATALALIVGFMVVEVVVAVVSGSLALLADAGHMLTDAGALAGSIWAIRLAARPARGQWTFGFQRAEILSAAINGATLLGVALVVFYESVRRLLDPPPVPGGPLVVIAGLGVVVNIGATWILAKANRTSLNIEGAFQHILTDAAAFVATLIAGVVLLTTGYRRADGIASLAVVALLLRAAWGLLRDSGRVLLEAAPASVDLERVLQHLKESEHVLGVHDLHIWTVTSGTQTLSAHVVVDDSCFLGGHAPQLLDEIQACLAGHFDVAHSTFQLESRSHAAHELGAHH